LARFGYKKDGALFSNRGALRTRRLSLAKGGEKKARTGRNYRPTVESLEALRLLSSATQAHALTHVAAEHDLRSDSFPHVAPLAEDNSPVSSATWDAALVQTQLDEILNPHAAQAAAPSASVPTAAPRPAGPIAGDIAAVASGLSQLNKYLSRAWYRAGIPAQLHDDNSQGVYTALLQSLGRQRFDSLVSDVSHSGVKDVFSRETDEGLAFFRAVDMVKKRAQRERVHQSLDSIDVPAQTHDLGPRAARRTALLEAIEHSLSPREASLIQDTLMGKTPAEIAFQWGVAPKTVSNEKSRVIQKLRDALAQHELN
jgi:DNA-binding CsgD family transcriptional regulator